MQDLSKIRKRIDAIDAQICDLFSQRMQCTHEVAEYKRANNKPVLDRGRERAKLADVASKVPESLRDYSQVLFNLIMEISRAQQSAKNNQDSPLAGQISRAVADTPALFPQSAFVACQGVEGAYSQHAADRLFKHATISYFEEFDGVFRAVDQGFCKYGVLPVENSTAGTVNQVYDLMMRHKFSIVRSVRIKVDHNLLALPGAKLEGIRDIYSHQQAINQSRQFLDSLPNVTVHVAENTAAAAKMVAESGRTDVATLSSRSCAELYNLIALARNVQDSDANYTRFACIAKELEIYPGADRTSLMVVTKNDPGSLYKVLARFYALDINLVKLESRPIPNSDFDFMFYFDVECPVAAPEFASLIASLDDVCEEYRYLGSYSELV
ncbi:bifunctional chorismate mutase/prephenate dehydratase [uncultured Parolsenella sp.]|uniref:bifunctional chorismate mutase/prephenate dehydratase n=1 Tax=uncultured Parolsenella sp. TaxID=2083008 RepID=UPI0025EE2195|nr:bifunctional chorismate mutase/prephenate dehydratase [uncultured Parolsenella sp.]